MPVLELPGKTWLSTHNGGRKALQDLNLVTGNETLDEI